MSTTTDDDFRPKRSPLAFVIGTLLVAGAGFGIYKAVQADAAKLTPEQAELQRIRQGFPAAPSEANDDTNPFELGLAPWVSLNKGCYVGQETLAKLATYDGVKQQLRHWCCAGGSQPTPGSALTTGGGERAGVIRSCMASDDGFEGLALVRRNALDQSTLLAEGSVSLSISTPPAFVAPPTRA